MVNYQSLIIWIKKIIKGLFSILIILGGIGITQWLLNINWGEGRNSAQATNNTVNDKIEKEKPNPKIIKTELNHDNHVYEITTTGSNTNSSYNTFIAVQDGSGRTISEYPFSGNTQNGKVSIPIESIPDQGSIVPKCEYIGTQRLADGTKPECNSSREEITVIEKPNYVKMKILGVDATFEDDVIKLTTARSYFEDKGAHFYSSYSVGKNPGEGALRIDSKKLFPGRKILFIFIDQSIFPKGSITYGTIISELEGLYPHLNEVKVYSFEDISSALDNYNESNDIRYILSYIGDCDNTVTGPCDEGTSYVRKFSKKLLKNNNVNVFFIVPATTETIRNKN